MANCIAIDASSEACSVSLVVNTTTTNATSDTPKSHAKSLLPFVHELLSLQQITLSDLDFIACSKGPGSFTGLRIGLGIAQGLAFGAQKSMVGVSSLESMARSANLLHPQAEIVISLLDARMGEIYWSAMAFMPTGIASLVEPRLDAIAEVTHELNQLLTEHRSKPALIAGAATELLDLALLRRAAIDVSIAPNAEMIATIALEKWDEGCFCVPQDFQLDYLRNSVSWNKRQRIRS